VKAECTASPLRHTIYRTALVLLIFIAGTTPLFAGGSGEQPVQPSYSVAVFVPGVVEGSPTYEMLVAGVKKAVSEAENVNLKVVEGGFNQAEWPQGVTSLAATGSYDLIVTSNPSMPEICNEVSKSFPDQKFLILDGYLTGNKNMYTVLFNQREQAFLVGHFAGLVTTSSMKGVNGEAKVGLLAGQEYPIMNNVILPGFELGLKTVAPKGSVDFRVLGNWYDAGKATELANSMIDSGSDVILTIAGGGNQGVITAARNKGAYVLWYDTVGYEQAPGIVIGSSYVLQDKAAYEKTKAAIEGSLSFGNAIILGVRDGYVGFDTENRLYTKNVPQDVQDAQAAIIARMKSGDLKLEMPTTF